MIPGSGLHSVSLRQAGFFAVTIILPCAVIAVMAGRMLIQDREILATRVAAARRDLVTEARHALLERAAGLRSMANDAAGHDLPPGVVVSTALDGRQMVLPWEQARDSVDGQEAVSQRRFEEAISRGEREEFGTGDVSAAAAVYVGLAGSTTQPGHRAWARLLSARAFTKAGRPADAHTAARAVLETAGNLADDQGIPFVVYAARVLAASTMADADDAAMIGAAVRKTLGSPTISPAAIYMMKDAVSGNGADRDVADVVAARARDIEQILALRAALPTLGIAESAGDSEPTWVRFGPADNMWLVNIQRRGQARALIAVRAAPLIESVQRELPVAITASAEGESLAPDFPGLRATIAPAALATVEAESHRQRPFYLGALILVVSVAVFGGVLFWRDIRRDIRVAALRSQFVSSVSHELKTPLTAIRMFAETLLTRPARPEVQREYLGIIVNESERLTRLLNNVLDFSSIESGRRTYRLEPQPLGSIVLAAAKAMEYPLHQQGFELRIAIAADVPQVAADADAIQQAVLNLLSNAMKYSGEGRIIDLTLERAGTNAVIAVTDRGPGIAPEEQSRIFEKYYRVRDRATERVPGTGLGLTLVEHVALGHGARVTVRSAPGQGSTFALVLPVLTP